MTSIASFCDTPLATLAYRAGKALRDVPESFADFQASPGTRTPGQILSHMCDLADWALSQARGNEAWQYTSISSWSDGAARFHAALSSLDVYLAGDGSLGKVSTAIFQGAIADALTHTGQINMLRRMAGCPVRGENYSRADIRVGEVGAAQPAPVREFD